MQKAEFNPGSVVTSANVLPLVHQGDGFRCVFVETPYLLQRK